MLHHFPLFCGEFLNDSFCWSAEASADNPTDQIIQPIMSALWRDGSLPLALTIVTGKLTVHTQTACHKRYMGLQKNLGKCYCCQKPGPGKIQSIENTRMKQWKRENLKYPENCQFPQIAAHFIKAPILAPLQNPDKDREHYNHSWNSYPIFAVLYYGRK